MSHKTSHETSHKTSHETSHETSHKMSHETSHKTSHDTSHHTSHHMSHHTQTTRHVTPHHSGMIVRFDVRLISDDPQCYNKLSAIWLPSRHNEDYLDKSEHSILIILMSRDLSQPITIV